jgi:hypothetical protein
MTKVREYECDNEQDEEFVGVIQTELHLGEEGLLSRMVEHAVADARIGGRTGDSVEATEALAWLFYAGHADDIYTPLTFPWICNELEWEPENFRRPLRKKFEALVEDSAAFRHFMATYASWRDTPAWTNVGSKKDAEANTEADKRCIAAHSQPRRIV